MRPLSQSPPDVEAQGVGFRHVPALDGLRGLAIIGVLLFHAGRLRGGYLGVDLFFVLSGFLITSLLLAESDRTGSVRLGAFWARRARRLLPALAAVLVGVGLYCLVFADPTGLAQIRGDALATLGYVANWRAVFARRDYFAQFAAPSPLQHTWSLGIEEQFYVLWPLMFVGVIALGKRSTPKTVLVVSLVLVAVSTTLLIVLYDPANVSRVYYGTDTRAGGILLGAALAAWLAMRGPVRSRVRRGAVEVAGVFGVALLAVTWTHLGGQSPTLYRGGLLVCEVAVVAVLAAAVHPDPGPLSRVLSFRPLCLLGLISYGVYLWHWPIDVVLTPQRVHLASWWLIAVQMGTTLVVSLLSYRLVELPIRRGALSASQWRALTPVIAVALVLALIGSTAGAKSHAKESTTQQAIASAVRAELSAPPRAKRLMIVGNSVAFFLGIALQEVRAAPPVVTLNVGRLACVFPGDLTGFRIPGGVAESVAETGPSCSPDWRSAVDRFRPDIVLFALSGATGSEARIQGRWVHACQAAFDDNLDRGLRQAIKTLSARGAKVVLTTAAYARYGFVKPDRYTDCDNRVRSRVAAATGTPLVDLLARTCPHRNCINTDHGVTLRPDGLHYEGAGARLIARWLLEQLHADRLR